MEHVIHYISPGRHCCPWCEVESKSLKLPLNAQGPLPENPNWRKPSPSRSLKTLRRDYKNFITRGNGDLKKAKEYNNVIGPYFFDIPLDQVCGRTAFHIHTTLSLITQMAMTMVLSNWIKCFYRSVHLGCTSVSVFSRGSLIYLRLTVTAWTLRMLRAARLDHQHPFKTYSNSLQELATLSKEAETMSMQVTWLEQTRSCMILTSQDPESSGPLRIVTEELARAMNVHRQA